MGDPAKYLEIPACFADDGRPLPPLTPQNAANQLLGRNFNAFLLGLILDQQIPSERAFAGPYELKRRLGHLNLRKIAAMPADDFRAVMRTKPALHRYPVSMATRLQDASRVILTDFGGRAENIWRDQPDAASVMKRLATVPGIGPAKQRLALMLLGRYFAVDVPGWREVSPVPLPA